MFLVLRWALSLSYTPGVLLGSFAVFSDQCMFLYPSKKYLTYDAPRLKKPTPQVRLAPQGPKRLLRLGVPYSSKTMISSHDFSLFLYDWSSYLVSSQNFAECRLSQTVGLKLVLFPLPLLSSPDIIG